jgi:hypothetical protein
MRQTAKKGEIVEIKALISIRWKPASAPAQRPDHFAQHRRAVHRDLERPEITMAMSPAICQSIRLVLCRGEQRHHRLSLERR